MAKLSDLFENAIRTLASLPGAGHWLLHSVRWAVVVPWDDSGIEFNAVNTRYGSGHEIIKGAAPRSRSEVLLGMICVYIYIYESRSASVGHLCTFDLAMILIDNDIACSQTHLKHDQLRYNPQASKPSR